ncbi:MAG: GLUG motif-containing protein [Candidatus Nanopelagicales bacterium]
MIRRFARGRHGVVSMSATLAVSLSIASGAVTLIGVTAPPAWGIGCASGPFAGGAGTAADPYLLATGAQLRSVAADPSCWDSAFAMTGAIDLSAYSAGAGWTPIGNAGAPFRGSFDGRSHAITGLVVSDATLDDAGLFGVIEGATPAARASVTSLTITAGSISGRANVGALAGRVQSADITSVTASGSVSAAGSASGGLIGQVGAVAKGATVTSSSSSVVVTAVGQSAGGLVGVLNSGSSIDASSSSGAVTTSASTVGGLVGAAGGSVASSHATGNVTSTAGAGSANAGGLAGSSSSTITSSYATGSVSAQQPSIGGLVGSTSGSITNAYASGSVTGIGVAATNVGGLVGWFNMGGLIERSFSTGAVSGSSAIGGLIGRVTQSPVANAYSRGVVSGTSDVGGAIGVLDDPSVGSLSYSYATGAVTAVGAPVGGLVASGAPVTSSLWNSQSTGQALSAGGGGAATTAQMTASSSFPGWSLETTVTSATTWGLCPTLNDGYPFLQWYAIQAGWSCDFGVPPSAPTPQFLSYGRASSDETCEATWRPSWAKWMNDGTGGFTCDRMYAYDPATGTWRYM